MADKAEYVIGGIPVDVWGLKQLPNVSANGIAVLLLLHGRTGTKEKMRQTAEEAAVQSGERAKAGEPTLPLITVTFDHRNHGARMVDADRNKGQDENPTHAVDIMALISGGAQDVSLLLDYLQSVLFPTGAHTITRFAVAGFSLGAHVSWVSASRDIRISHFGSLSGSPSMASILSYRRAPMPSSLATLLRHTDADRLPLPLWEDKSVFVAANTDDELVPFEEGGTAEFIDQLKTVSKVVLVLGKGGHVYSDEQRKAFLQWVAADVCKVQTSV